MDALEYTLDAYDVMPEEDVARTSERNDLQIFAEVDGVLRDDNLLEPMSDLPDITEIFRKVDEFAPSTCLAFINILSDALQREDNSWWAHSIIAIMLLLGREGSSYLEGMTLVFQHVLLEQPRDTVPFIIRGSMENTRLTTESWQIHVFSTLTAVFKVVDPSILRSVVHRTYIKVSEEPTFESKTYSCLLDNAMPARTDNTNQQRRVPRRVLYTLLGLVISILQGMADRVTDSRALDASNIPHFQELLQFFLDAFPVMDRVTSNDRWFMHLHGQISDLMKSVLSTPALISILLECLGAHRGFLSPVAWQYVFCDPAQHVSKSLSADDEGNVLATITTFFQTKLHSKTQLTTYQTLVFTGCVPFRLPSSDDHRAQLKPIFALITASLNKASHLPTRSPPLSPSTDSELSTPKLLDEESNIISTLAHEILSRIDAHSADGLPSGAAIGPTGWHVEPGSGYVQEENMRYYKWRNIFDVGESIYPDELITLLRNLSTGETRNSRGRKCWRIRRLEDIERGNYYHRSLSTTQDATPSAQSRISLGLEDHGAEAVSDSTKQQMVSSGGWDTDYGEMMVQQAHESQRPMVREDPVVGAEGLRTLTDNATEPLGGASSWEAQNIDEVDRISNIQFGQTRSLAGSKEGINTGGWSVEDEEPSLGVVASVPLAFSATHDSPDPSRT
ncbi:hypothetical protein NM688_g8448 [Phlebia brevispora]|uniref:Uncharacterized protein n=1 Tax=Phlebia brevispora TaxID=194682 RepID=A0ACC1RUA6_9APHY|nr:hypothetical protein NM688_g8448 [Phlebia brevispora]